MNKEVVYSQSNRVGKFNVMREWLEDQKERPVFQALFSLCTILSSTEHESGRGQVFVAASDLFQPLLEGEEIPEYRIDFVYCSVFENPEMEQRRINSGSFGFVATRQIVVRAPAVSVGVQTLH